MSSSIIGCSTWEECVIKKHQNYKENIEIKQKTKKQCIEHLCVDSLQSHNKHLSQIISQIVCDFDAVRKKNGPLLMNNLLHFYYTIYFIFFFSCDWTVQEFIEMITQTISMSVTVIDRQFYIHREWISMLKIDQEPIWCIDRQFHNDFTIRSEKDQIKFDEHWSTIENEYFIFTSRPVHRKEIAQRKAARSSKRTCVRLKGLSFYFLVVDYFFIEIQIEIYCFWSLFSDSRVNLFTFWRAIRFDWDLFFSF